MTISRQRGTVVVAGCILFAFAAYLGSSDWNSKSNAIRARIAELENKADTATRAMENAHRTYDPVIIQEVRSSARFLTDSEKAELAELLVREAKEKVDKLGK